MKKTGFSMLLFVLFFLFLKYPEVVKSGAGDGLSLWYHSIVPILFPFLILSGIITSTDASDSLLKPFFLLSEFLPFFDPWHFYAFFFGIFCGYPMGAKIISDLVRRETITKQEGACLLPFVNQPSPMFLAGYLGNHIFKSRIPLKEIFLILYGIPFFIILLCSPFFYFKKRRRDIPFSAHRSGITKNFNPSPSHNKNSMSHVMEHTIWNSFSIIVTIGVYMMLFTIIAELGVLLLPDSSVFAVLISFLEFSSGLERISSMETLSSPVKTALLFSLTSFGGLCTAAQTSGILKDSGLNSASYLIKKTVYGLLLFLLVYSSVSS